jgi:hypothetical protein
VRMWNVPPKLLCRQHLLGEHVEMHMFAGAHRRGYNLSGYVRRGLLNPERLLARHVELAREIVSRGWRHQSPLEEPVLTQVVYVDGFASLEELARRCSECHRRQKTLLPTLELFVSSQGELQCR